MDSTRRWKRLGFNVTKVIDLNNCTEADFEVINNVAPGPNENQATVSVSSDLTNLRSLWICFAFVHMHPVLKELLLHHISAISRLCYLYLFTSVGYYCIEPFVR